MRRRRAQTVTTSMVLGVVFDGATRGQDVAAAAAVTSVHVAVSVGSLVLSLYAVTRAPPRVRPAAPARVASLRPPFVVAPRVRPGADGALGLAGATLLAAW